MNFNEVNDKLTNSKHGGGASLNNNNNASSKRYAIIFGIFALVIVTTAASFAFFTYSRTGQTTTTITSGDIEFSFIEGTNAFLTDAFPVSDSVGANDASGEYTFDVKMSSSSSNNKMTYNVYLVDNNKATQDDEGNEIKYFSNEQIEFALIKNGTYVAGTSGNVGKKLTDVTGFNVDSSIGEGLVLENQEIIANTKDNYKLRIWISDDVNYSNTIDSSGTMTGKFNGYKYSLKVKVTSGVETTTTVSEPVGRVIVANLADSNGISAYGVSTSEDSSTVTEWIEVTNDETANSNVVRTSTAKVTSKTIQHKVNGYGTYYLHIKNTLDEITTKKVDVKIKEVSKDTSGAATPVIKGNLVPVIMNGSDVIKADTTKGWYNYDQAIWANAVILNDNYGPYENGSLIPEEAIESYFVWIPRYEYKIFDEGNYTTLVEQKGAASQEIEIRFVDKDRDEIQNGSTVGTWLTHPVFTSFDSNGMWVGKFESGYRGATSVGAANNNDNDSSKLIIKPNVYSWRGIQIANAHLTSFNYERNLDSHVMKNTEWGAVVYLTHSKYGTGHNLQNNSVRLNNNSIYVTGYSSTVIPTIGYNGGTNIEGNISESKNPGNDGEYTINYLNANSVKSSTTGNYSGIYDMAGGSWEFVMGVALDSDGNPYSGKHNAWNSGFQGMYSCPTCTENNVTVDNSQTSNTTGIPFPEDKKYYDSYSNSSVWYKYNTRILGDATGELGPFYQEKDPDGTQRNKSYWGGTAHFVHKNAPWFSRGAFWNYGTVANINSFYTGYGTASSSVSFRVVLTPQE